MASAKPAPEFYPDTTYVYVIGIPGGPYKIGYSRTPRLRVMEAIRQGRGEAGIIREWEFPRHQTARCVEHYAHWLLREHHYGGEWFNVTEAEAIAAVEHAVRPEALAAYDESDFIPSITQHRKGTELFVLRFEKGTGARMSAVLGTHRGQADFVRRAVEDALARAEAATPRNQTDP